jgi:Chaperone of endosialidase
MRRITTALATIVVVVTAAITALAQSTPAEPSVTVPRLIQIAGVFQPADGQPPANVEVVTVSIYSERDGGLPIWQERQTVAVDKTTGRFMLLLGASYPEGIPGAVFGAGQAQWMSLLFERLGEVEQPRVRIASVPYALKASDAETLGGLPASAYLRASTDDAASVGVAKGDSSPETSTEVSAPDVLPGTTNFLAKYVNGADVGNSAVFETPTVTVPTGAVGIGTTTPLDQLHLRFTNTNGAITGLAVQNLGNTTASYSGMLFYDQNGALGQFQGFNNVTHEYRINNIATNPSINFMTGSLSRFFVSSNGNIGIGTTLPGATLEVSNVVQGTSNGNLAVSTFGNTNFGSAFFGRKARGTTAAPTAVLSGDLLATFGGRGHTGTAFSGDAGSIRVIATENWTDSARGTRLGFVTTPNGTNTPLVRMFLDPNGRLGMGTNSPSSVVEVVRDGEEADFRATSFDAGGGAESSFQVRHARGTLGAPSAVQLGDELGFFAMTGYGATGFGEFGGGLVGLAAENWTDTAQGTALLLAVTPNGTNQAEGNVVVLPGGNVGIGVFNDFPTITDKLQVFGDIRIGTAGTNGCIRRFDGTGILGTCASDRRYKKDVTPFSSVLNQLTALQPVHYFWRAADFPQQQFGDSRAYGLIAQDVEEVLPELVVTNEDGFKAVDYTKLPLLTIQAVKELKAENEELKAGNEALKQRVDELERLVRERLATQSPR